MGRAGARRRTSLAPSPNMKRRAVRLRRDHIVRHAHVAGAGDHDACVGPSGGATGGRAAARVAPFTFAAPPLYTATGAPPSNLHTCTPSEDVDAVTTSSIRRVRLRPLPRCHKLARQEGKSEIACRTRIVATPFPERWRCSSASPPCVGTCCWPLSLRAARPRPPSRREATPCACATQLTNWCFHPESPNSNGCVEKVLTAVRGGKRDGNFASFDLPTKTLTLRLEGGDGEARLARMRARLEEVRGDARAPRSRPPVTPPRATRRALRSASRRRRCRARPSTRPWRCTPSRA